MRIHLHINTCSYTYTHTCTYTCLLCMPVVHVLFTYVRVSNHAAPTRPVWSRVYRETSAKGGGVIEHTQA